VVAAVVETLRHSVVAATPGALSRNTVNAAMRQSARLLASSAIPAQVVALTERAARSLFWMRLRLLVVPTIAVTIASSGAGVYRLGSQESAAERRADASSRSDASIAQAPPPKFSATAAEPPATAAPDARAQLRAQQLATRKAKVAYQIAKLTRELAEIAVEEYAMGQHDLELAKVEEEIVLARSELSRAEDRLDWSNQMLKKGYVSKAQNVADAAALTRKKLALEISQSKKKVLEKYTGPKNIMELKREVEKARADELAKEGALESEMVKQLVLEEQLGVKAQ
jgi:hypothetical protein